MFFTATTFFISIQILKDWLLKKYTKQGHATTIFSFHEKQIAVFPYIFEKANINNLYNNPW